MNLRNILKYFPSIILLSFGIISAQNSKEINIYDLEPGELEYASFELKDDATIIIKGEAANFGKKFANNYAFYGWIINSESREIVWDARDNYDFENMKGVYEFDEQEPLDMGVYEVYYAASQGYSIEINSFSDLMSNLFSGFKGKKFKEKYKDELGITISSSSDKFRVLKKESGLKKAIESAIVSINHVGDDADIHKGFAINDDTLLRIYSLGEGREDGIFDQAWITNAKNNKVVWKVDLKETEYAGGGKKNYLVDKIIKLPSGNYYVNYSTDDSHSFDGWNVMPPNDPQFWGITIWAASENDLKNVIPFDDSDILKPMIEIIKVGDDEYISKGFKLDSESTLNIVCLGEGYNEKDLADFGWIINADNKEVVWSMNGNPKLKHAGGAKKNLMVDENIELPAGNYIVFYRTDDSHSYGDWNASNPFNKTRWGITIWTDADYELFNPRSYKSKNILAEIVKVGDNEKIEKTFYLNKNADVKIYAIGEGGRSGMDDYGWIEDEDGDVVWEMTYRKTKHAGGADKNRLFNKTIYLKKGKYSVYYTTDDSHSYDEWNSSPPRNPEAYGITVIMEK